MTKTVLVTGATDGLGLATAKRLASEGCRLVLHGRNPEKLAAAEAACASGSVVDRLVADFSRLSDVAALADAVDARDVGLDVLVNNAGVFRTGETRTSDGLDVRFAVNTIAPYLLARRLAPRLGGAGRIVNLSSAAQAPVALDALSGTAPVADAMSAYAQSKLALTIWSQALGRARTADAPLNVAVNPGSLLGTKMVRDGFGVAGGDVAVGADVLARAALSEAFADASGAYFDNDAGRFGAPHPDAAKPDTVAAVVATIERTLGRVLGETWLSVGGPAAR